MTKESHSLNKQPHYHKGSIILDDRDLSTLIWVCEQSAVSLDHLRLLLGARSKKPTKEQGILSASAADQVLKRWQMLHLIEQKKILAT